jgi:hypothetical protein
MKHTTTVDLKPCDFFLSASLYQQVIHPPQCAGHLIITCEGEARIIIFWMMEK